jgi:hypothetical protein
MKRLLQLAALTIVLPLAGQAAMALPVPNYCGDPCSPEGERVGCRCQDAQGYYRRTICTCFNGRWVDF